jgi:hypothetical protein
MALGVAGLAACSEASEPASTPSAAAPSASATVGLPAPIIADPGNTQISAKVGQTIVFNTADPANSTTSVVPSGASDPQVLAVTQGYDDGSAQFNPSAQALAPGTATVRIVGSDGTTTEYMVNVS